MTGSNRHRRSITKRFPRCATFGGRVTSYESLLDRARRESLLRMKQQASSMGAVMVFNVKYETASIEGRRQHHRQRRGAGLRHRADPPPGR